MTDELYIGLMSGTSLDGIDAVVVAIGTNNIRLIESYKHSVPDELRQQILEISTGQKTTVSNIGLIDHQLGHLFAASVNKLLAVAQLQPEQITAIGNHGQTVWHQPTGEAPFTMQLGDANIIAAQTEIDTIADFRRIDMALGGQGAPLVPAFHQFLFSQRDSTTVVLNIGGIANVSVIPAHGPVTGFDTGPGNMLLDAWCEKQCGKKFDEDGRWAQQGQLNTALLNQLMSDSYLTMPAPKSTGREHYNLAWLELQLDDSIPPQDVQHTLSEFTALTIAQQVQPFAQGMQCELLVCGGGAHNPLLMQRLQHHLPDWAILPTSTRGIPGDYMEAMAFAWLARQKVHKLPGNLPAVTGAKCEASLGVLYAAVRNSDGQ